MYKKNNKTTDLRVFSNTSTGKGQVTNTIIDVLIKTKHKKQFEEILKDNEGRIISHGGNINTIKVWSPGEGLLDYVYSTEDSLSEKAQESPFGLADGGALAQLTEKGIELRDDIPMSDALKDWNIQHEKWHKRLDGNTKLSNEIKEVVAIILAFQEAELDKHLKALLRAFDVGSEEIPEDLSNIDLIKGVIGYCQRQE